MTKLIYPSYLVVSTYKSIVENAEYFMCYLLSCVVECLSYILQVASCSMVHEAHTLSSKWYCRDQKTEKRKTPTDCETIWRFLLFFYTFTHET